MAHSLPTPPAGFAARPVEDQIEYVPIGRLFGMVPMALGLVEVLGDVKNGDVVVKRAMDEIRDGSAIGR